MDGLRLDARGYQNRTGQQLGWPTNRGEGEEGMKLFLLRSGIGIIGIVGLGAFCDAPKWGAIAFGLLLGYLVFPEKPE